MQSRWLAIAAVSLTATFCMQAAGNLALIDAVKNGNDATVRTLLAQHADVSATEADGSTALHWAAQRNDAIATDLLLAAGAKADAATRYNITPLALACTNGNAAIIERLLKAGADPNGISSEGQTALMTAARNGNVTAIKALLTHGARINTQEPFRGQTAVMWAAGEGNTAAVEMLVEFGADVKSKSRAGFTPLLFAIRNHHTDAAKALLEHGADVEDRAPDGTTALNMAVVNGYYDLASVLLDYHANPNARDPNGSPLHSLAWLRKPGTPWEAAGLGEDPVGPPRQTGDVTSEQLAKKLLAHGEDPNARIAWQEMRMTAGLGTTSNPPNIPLGRHFLSFVGATPFYVAARNGDAPFMRLLVAGKADPNISTQVGVTPLMAAAGLDPAAVQLVRVPGRDAAFALVRQPGLIPLVILRGSGDSTRALAREAALHGVRTLAHADGGAVLFIDQSADLSLALQLIERSLDRLGVCNRLNLLLVHRAAWDEVLPAVTELAGKLGISLSLPPHQHELGHEWALDSGAEATITIAPAAGPADAAEIANTQTSGLAASIVAADQSAARKFLDAYAGTGAFWNATTRLLDGFKLLSLPETGINIDVVPGPRGPVTYRDLHLRQYVVAPRGAVQTG